MFVHQKFTITLEEFSSVTCVHVRDAADEKASDAADVPLPENICQCHFAEKNRGTRNPSENYLAKFSPILAQINKWHSICLRRCSYSLLQCDSKAVHCPHTVLIEMTSVPLL